MHNVNIILSIVSANVGKNLKSIVSLSNEKIIFPSFSPSRCDDIFLDIQNELTKYFYNDSINIYDHNILLLDVNSYNMNNIFNTDNTINILYGIVLPMLSLRDGYYWYNFEFSDTSIPNELSIIGETIRRGF